MQAHPKIEPATPAQLDVQALTRALPISGLEPQAIAHITGLVGMPEGSPFPHRIPLLEPPAGQHQPYIEPIYALEAFLRRQGLPEIAAKEQALTAALKMRAEVADVHWVCFLNSAQPSPPEQLPLPELITWLRNQSSRSHGTGTAGIGSAPIHIAPEILDFLEQVTQKLPRMPQFTDPDHWNITWPLIALPEQPPPKAMMEFLHRPLWADDDDAHWVHDPDAYYPMYLPFQRWREAMRPVAQALEAALGEPVYRFANLASDIDDDDVHRFLVLHWCCTQKPDSGFVRYLLKASGAHSVEALKAALINLANYTQAYKMHDTSLSCMEVCPCPDFHYSPPQTHEATTPLP